MELLGLNSRPGVGVQQVIRSKFGCSVSPSTNGRPFFLVASFGRCKFKLSPPLVGAILSATIGGSASDFQVLGLADRVFRFSVSSRLVGFHIFKLRSFECPSFKVFFHLWGNGGPNWIKEWRSFCSEEEAAWTEVKKNRPNVGNSLIRPNYSFVDAVKTVPLTGANRVPLAPPNAKKSVFGRIEFPSISANYLRKGKASIGQSHSVGAVQSKAEHGLNFGSNWGQQSSAENPLMMLQRGICSRCLSDRHPRAVCKSQIRCHSCMRGGHIAANCLGGNGALGSKMRDVTAHINAGQSLGRPETVALGTYLELGLAQRSPAAFNPSVDWARDQPFTSHASQLPEVAAALQLISGPGSSNPHRSGTGLNQDRIFTDTNAPSPFSDNFTRPLTNSATLPSAGKPPFSSAHQAPLQQSPFTLTATTAASDPAMAFQRAQPGPFKPRGMQIQEIPNRPMMVRAVARSRPTPRNEDLAIVTIHPLSGNPLHFPTVQEIIRDFFSS